MWAGGGSGNPGSNQRQFGVSAKEKLYAFLCSRPAGADATELVGLLLSGAGSDPELGARIVRRMLAGDPNFVFDSDTALWSLRKSDALRVPLDEARFCVVDLETTGGRAGPGTIIDIGAYRMVGQRITDSFQSLVRPHSRVPRFITSLTSITNEMLADAPPIEEVLPAFREFIGDAVMVAHNAQFDRSFLDYEFRRIFGIGLGNPVLCTLRMARRYLPSLKRRRLDYIADHFGLSTAGRHRGLGDARMAAGDSLHLPRHRDEDGNHTPGPPDRRASARSRRTAYRAPRPARRDRGASARARRLPDAQ